MARGRDFNQAPISVEGFVDSFIGEAIKQRASDVHIEPIDNGVLRFRFRIDGFLHEHEAGGLLDTEKLISRIKVMSGLDITIHDVPQEGHFIFYYQDGINPVRMIDVRVSIFPTIYGEAIVLRVLNRTDLFVDFNQLGFDDAMYQIMNRLLHHAHGIVLVTGPVNSGKTTTLYALLNELCSDDKNIVTLEDPVEYHMPKIRQSQISHAKGFTYAAGLRSILRQDPDIIMVGEIRDPETAEIGFRASLTGRHVYSTLHTNTAIGTIARLIDMGVEPWLVAYALNGVITQRLVRKVCNKCRVDYLPSAEVLKVLNVEPGTGDVFYRGAGCEQCHRTGFYGRMGIFEVLELEEDFRNLILERASSSVLLAKAVEKGMKFLRDDGVAKAKQGLTTLEEVARVSI